MARNGSSSAKTEVASGERSAGERSGSDRKKLLKLFKLLSVGLADPDKAGVKPQEAAFSFVKGRILAFNGEIAVSSPIPTKLIAVDGKAIPGQPLFQLLDRLSDDELKIELDDKEIRFQGGRIRAGVPLLDLLDETKDHSKKIRKKGFDESPCLGFEVFSDALRFAMYSCGKDMSVPALTCVHIRGADGIVEASDNYRASRYSLNPFMPTSCLIPASSIKEISDYNFDSLYHEDPWFHLQVGKSVISLRTFKAEFPDMDAVGIFKRFKNEAKFELPKSIDEILDRMAIFAARDYFLDERISVKLAKDRMIVRADGHQGWIEETVRVRYGDEEKQFEINPQFLKEILKHTRECSLTKTKLRFQAEVWEHVVSLPVKE